MNDKREKKIMPDDQDIIQDNDVPKGDEQLTKYIIIFMIILILLVIFIPSEWLMKWSLWWNNIQLN